jgi:hypothetical protein
MPPESSFPVLHKELPAFPLITLPAVRYEVGQVGTASFIYRDNVVEDQARGLSALRFGEYPQM